MLGGIVRGRLTTLRVPTEADLTAFAGWSADMRVRALLTRAYWEEPAMPATWKERLAKQSEDKGTVLWTIDADGAPVGLCRVQLPSDPVGASYAEGGIDVTHFTIAPDRWRQGLGWDAALTLHRWIFDIVHARQALAVLAAHNVAALRITERLGYVAYAHGHAVRYGDGRYEDELQQRMHLDVWDERWGASEREYEPLGDELEA